MVFPVPAFASKPAFKIGAAIVLGVAILLALFFMFRAIYNAGQDAKDAQWRAEISEQNTEILEEIRGFETRDRARMIWLDQSFGERLADIENVNITRIQPILEREIRNDPRLTDPDFAISPELLGAINAARAVSACTRSPDGGLSCALPASGDGSERTDGDDSG